MIINKVSIKKFRGFKDVEFELGSHLTVIAGQNGTQKTTMLGMLSQPFSITEGGNPMRDEKPLCGGSFKSAFSDKFKISHNKYDKVGEHEWTLVFNDKSSYTVESIYRNKKEGTIRFWKKGSKGKGSGYVQIPVIYLSLKRLLPIGEDNDLKENSAETLTEDEFDFYQKRHNKILLLTKTKDKILSSNYLSSTNKETLGANTDYYDWVTNSAGQDNIGKILLAILSFKRLKAKYPNEYKGGILAIDEIDATFFSGSQIELIHALIKFASDFDIQIIFTTHSLTILEAVSKLQEEKHRIGQTKIMFLKKEDNQIVVEKDVDYNFIKNHLNKTLTGHKKQEKIEVYTEDRECMIFAKSLLGSKRTKYLKFVDIPLSCSNLIDLSARKIPSFSFPNSIIILDGDVKKEKSQYNRTKKIKNVLLLPTTESPERVIANFLHPLSDKDPLRSSVDRTFDQQYCFKDYSNDEIQKDREKAKKWFNCHLELWGRNAYKILNPWKKVNKKLVNEFNHHFEELYKKFLEKNR